MHGTGTCSTIPVVSPLVWRVMMMLGVSNRWAVFYRDDDRGELRPSECCWLFGGNVI